MFNVLCNKLKCFYVFFLGKWIFCLLIFIFIAQKNLLTLKILHIFLLPNCFDFNFHKSRQPGADKILYISFILWHCQCWFDGVDKWHQIYREIFEGFRKKFVKQIENSSVGWIVGRIEINSKHL